ncbi:MAG: hypothetical protein FWC69_02755 [Defluviitaleaceae bacterium]|nr:hypothetical protein [Defluviitaleaceae bacterium]
MMGRSVNFTTSLMTIEKVMASKIHNMYKIAYNNIDKDQNVRYNVHITMRGVCFHENYNRIIS